MVVPFVGDKQLNVSLTVTAGVRRRLQADERRVALDVDQASEVPRLYQKALGCLCDGVEWVCVGCLCGVLKLRSGAETESRKSKSENPDFENSFESKKDTDEVYFERFGVDRKEGCVASLCWW